MARYINLKEQIKAAEVRKLVNEANQIRKKININTYYGQPVDKLVEDEKRLMMQADKLSFELVDYLKRNYPINFIIYDIPLPQQLIDHLYNLKTLPQMREDKNIINFIHQYNQILPIHSILLLTEGKNGPIFYILFNNDGHTSFSLNTSSSDLVLADEFYQFMEEMGLTLNAVNKLYDTDEIIAPPGVWPNVVHLGKKVL